MASNEQNPFGNILSQVLSDPQKINQLRQMASSLGLGGGSGENSSPEPPPPPPQETPSSNMFSSLQNIFSSLPTSDPHIDFLRSMQPLLSERRAKKVDDAIRIMQLIELLPLIRESGLFPF